jgi:hypothetical protein
VTQVPPGKLLLFAPDSVNRGFGHVGISLGGGRMISALNGVEVTNISSSPYWSRLYRGWASAPASWPGRIPPPPGTTEPLSGSAVQITAPAFDSTVSGTIDLSANAANVGGVAFYGYYAANPSSESTIGWHLLGDGVSVGGGYWTLVWNTATIPDQGRPAWGTVNISAVALDNNDQETGTRDYRRITVDNSAPGITTTTTPTTTTPPTGTTYPETAGGVAHTWTDYSNAAGTQGQSIAAYQTVQIACKVAGFRVTDGNTWWYEVAQSPWSGNFYVSADAFYNNGSTSGSLSGTPFVDPAVPNC